MTDSTGPLATGPPEERLPFACLRSLEFEQLTSARCAAQAALFRQGLANFSVSVTPTSDVGRMIAALEWMGSFPPDSPQPDTAWAADRERAKRSFPLVEQATRIAQALVTTRDVPGADKLAAKLRKKLDRLISQDEQAQDFLFELELGARCVAHGLSIEFDEPDIVVRLSDGDRFGIACKRPRNVARMRERIREATRQVQSGSQLGIIAIGIEPLFHHSGDIARPTIVYRADSAMARSEANGILDRAVMAAIPDIRSAFDDGVAGILFCGVITGWAKEVQPGRDAYHSQWIHRSISHPNAEGVAAAVEKRLFEDHGATSA